MILLAANLLYTNVGDPEVKGLETDTAGNTLVGGPGNDRLLGSDKADVLIGKRWQRLAERVGRR